MLAMNYVLLVPHILSVVALFFQTLIYHNSNVLLFFDRCGSYVRRQRPTGNGHGELIFLGNT